MPVERFRQVSARLAVDPTRDDVDSAAERLAALLSAEEVGRYWARLQFELGEVPGLVGDVVSRSHDAEQYDLMEQVLANGRAFGVEGWGERFLDVADRAVSLIDGRALNLSFTPHGVPDFSPWRDYSSLVMGYFRGRKPSTSQGEEFFYAFTTPYYSGGGFLFPRDLGRAQADLVLAPLGLELAGEPQFQEYASTTMMAGPTIELAF